MTVEERQVGRTRFEKARARRRDRGQPAGPRSSTLAARTRSRPRPRCPAGRRPPRRARPRHRSRWRRPSRRSFLKVRVRDLSVPALTDGPLPSPDTIAGAFIRDLEARIAELEAAGVDGRGGRAARRPSPRAAAPRRPRGLAVRVRRLSGPGFPALPRRSISTSPRRDRHPRPQRGRQDHDPAGPRAGPDPPGDEHRGRGRGAPALGTRRRRPARSSPSSSSRTRRTAGRSARSRRPSPVEGDGPPRLRRPVDHRPDPRRPGHGRADRHPDRGLLPVDRLGPPFRAERPVARRGRAARPPPGVDQRRRPRHEPGTQEARPGAPRPEHQAATATRAGSRSPSRPSSSRGWRSSRASWPWPSSNATATRWPTRASAAPRPRPSLAERRSMLEKARQAERIAAERDAATERYERYRRRSRSHAEIAGPGRPPIRRPTRCRVLRGGGRAPADARQHDPRAAGDPRRTRSTVQFEVAPEPTWRPLSRVSVALVVLGILLAGGPVLLEVLGHRRSRCRSSRSSAAIIALVGVALAAVALWLRRSVKMPDAAARRRDRPSTARSVGDGGRARRRRS